MFSLISIDKYTSQDNVRVTFMVISDHDRAPKRIGATMRRDYVA